jgi:hypothetical protein
MAEPSLEELLSEACERSLSRKCWAALAIESGDQRLAEYLAAISSPEWSGRVVLSKVSKQLKDRFGVNVGDDGVRKHVRGECSCKKT